MVSMVDYHINSKTVAVPRLQTVAPQHGDCSFYRWITEYVQSGCAGSCSALTWKSRQREVKAARHINTTDLPPKELYVQGSRNRANLGLEQTLSPLVANCSSCCLLDNATAALGLHDQTWQPFLYSWTLFWHKHTLTIIFAHHKVHITPSIKICLCNYYSYCSVYPILFIHTPVGCIFIFRSELDKSFIAADCCDNYSAHDKQYLKHNHTEACT